MSGNSFPCFSGPPLGYYAPQKDDRQSTLFYQKIILMSDECIVDCGGAYTTKERRRKAHGKSSGSVLKHIMDAFLLRHWISVLLLLLFPWPATLPIARCSVWLILGAVSKVPRTESQGFKCWRSITRWFRARRHMFVASIRVWDTADILPKGLGDELQRYSHVAMSSIRMHLGFTGRFLAVLPTVNTQTREKFSYYDVIS